MTYDELVAQLTADLQEAGNENITPPSDMSDSEARDWAMANVAEAIAKAIYGGIDFSIKGSATCGELNALTTMAAGDTWAVEDSGTLNDGALAVTAGDLVRWTGDEWSVFLHIDLSNYVTQAQLATAVQNLTAAISTAVTAEASTRAEADTALGTQISTHENRTDNPHQVTAHQVGAYTQQETDDRISDALSGEVGGWLGNLTVAAVNALTTHKKGDSATMLDAGIVNPGNLSVSIGDDIMWVDSQSVWQAKTSDRIHHDSTITGDGSTASPLGVNQTIIDNNVLRIAAGGAGEMIFYRGTLNG